MPLINSMGSGTYDKLVLIPGNCLFHDLSAVEPESSSLFFMAEDRGLCTRFIYHKHKLVMMLSAMRSYRDWLAERLDLVYYGIEDATDRSYKEKLAYVLENHGIEKLVTYEFEDEGFSKLIRTLCKEKEIILETVAPPGFINSVDEFKNYRGDTKKLLMNNFYIFQRKRMGYLINADGKPAGGKWNFDKQNREVLPDSVPVPSLPSFSGDVHTGAVVEFVEREFSSHPGNGYDFYLPATRDDALLWLDDFLKYRLKDFGPYEDAIRKGEPFLFHSVLSPLLNIGLLTPFEVVEKSLDHYENNRDTIPLSSIEGFIRQIIGWREFMRGMYHGPDMRGNFFGHQRKLSEKWYTGELGIEAVDDVIGKVLKYGYCHHIERLMVLGNFMLLCEIHPDEVYRWFMELFVDAYEWVMVPNIYGMSQFADGGTLSTKPYISGSNYILKMSDYRKGSWCDVWDALYWRFIDKNKDVLRKTFRMGMMVSAYERMDSERKSNMQKIAENFLETL